MSRVGKMPVAVPAGVDVSIKEDQISVKGTGGALFLTQNALVKVVSDGGKLSFAPLTTISVGVGVATVIPAGMSLLTGWE